MIFALKQAPPYFLYLFCSTADESCEHKSTLVSQIHKKLKNVLTLSIYYQIKFKLNLCMHISDTAISLHIQALKS